jgi:prepilin-type N-terminal cleavage/methylation domain-containing protein
MRTPAPTIRPRARGFSIIEMLVALTITATLLSAAFVALDTSFKSYKATTEGASTHVVSRIVMYRIMSMVRNGTEFGPYPEDPLDLAQNPVFSDYIEFIANSDAATGKSTLVKIEKRNATDPARGPFELWYVQTDLVNGAQTGQTSSPLITNLQDARFRLEYDIGPRLLQATVDITVAPNDVQDANIHSDLAAPTVRFVSSAAPRKLEVD